jgi:malate permease and related proteins
LNNVLSVITGNILPILIVAGFGYLLRRWFAVDQRHLSSAVLNVLSPALVFSSLVNSVIEPQEFARIGLFAVLTIASMGILGFVLAPLLRLTRVETSTLMVLLMFVNSGNYGLTLVQLRYGDAGLSRAVVYYTVSTILIYTLGVFIASSGRVSWRDSLSRMARLPAVYAAVLAIIVFAFKLTVPSPLMNAIEIAGAGAIPVMLLVLGMQLADYHHDINWRLAFPAISLRLVGGPIVGFLVAGVLGLKGLSRGAAIVEASMPSAVFSIILATEFRLPAPAVTSIVVLGTLISPLTIAVTITLLGL